MAIREQEMSVDEAFRLSCEKNGIKIRKRKKSRNYIMIWDEECRLNIIKTDSLRVINLPIYSIPKMLTTPKSKRLFAKAIRKAQENT